MSTDSQTHGDNTDGLPKGKGLLALMLGLLAAGVGVAIYLVWHKLNITLDPDYVSSCNLGGAINCDKVNVSKWSEIFGFPLSLYAIPTYALMGYFVSKALEAVGSEDQDLRASGALGLKATTALGAVTVLHSAYLAYVSSVHVEAYCLYCISLYVVNLGVTVLGALAGAGNPVKAMFAALGSAARLASPIPNGVGVVVIAAGVSWIGYDMAHGEMETEYKARIDAIFAEAGDANTDSEAPATGTTAVKPSPSKAPAAPTKPAVPTKPAARPSSPPSSGPVNISSLRGRGKKTKDGWTIFDTPLRADEFWHGNPNATVTVVKYADFQCAYCRYLKSTMDPVKKKFKDRARFVMKHFPMNPKCNRIMQGYDKHPNACEASYAGHCAGEQGKFWEMHDKLYDNQNALDDASLRKYAEGMSLDLTAFDSCMKSPNTVAAIKKDIEIAIRAGIYGTPRTYINSRMVTGSASTSILEYYIERALAEGAPKAAAPVAQVMAPKPDGSSMIQGKTASTTFYIDPYEASITKQGAAVSIPGVKPSQASWHEAAEACGKAGKRLCTEEEWVSACTGVPAVDNNNNNFFADDAVEGPMYPYGAYYEPGACHDEGDKYEGRPVKTGSMERCRTPSGVFDLAGNISEWAGAEASATLLGGYAASSQRAACNQRSFSKGLGRRNHTTGFRCCADSNVTQKVVSADQIKEGVTNLVGQASPKFEGTTEAGKVINNGSLKGKITLINFFASWCGPCKKEFPYLVKYDKEYGSKGFQIIGIGGDTLPEKSIEFAKGYNVEFPIITDPDSVMSGQFNVFSMPATFLVDRKGVIRFMDTGFKPAEQESKLRNAINGLL